MIYVLFPLNTYGPLLLDLLHDIVGEIPAEIKVFLSYLGVNIVPC